MVKLQAVERTSKKSEIKSIRRKRGIPAVIYLKGKPNRLLALEEAEFNAILRKIKPGHLSTLVFDLKIGNEKERRVIVKDIQYQLTTYHVTHIDFQELSDHVPIKVNVPIECVGVINCMGVKLGGMLRQVIRRMKVECLPKQIPESFVVDVAHLGIKQSKRLCDIVIPEGVKPLCKMNEVVVIVSKRSG